jgi:hypothetical protein
MMKRLTSPVTTMPTGTFSHRRSFPRLSGGVRAVLTLLALPLSRARAEDGASTAPARGPDHTHHRTVDGGRGGYGIRRIEI